MQGESKSYEQLQEDITYLQRRVQSLEASIELLRENEARWQLVIRQQSLFAEKIHSSATTLLNISNGILDSSQTEAEKIEPYLRQPDRQLESPVGQQARGESTTAVTSSQVLWSPSVPVLDEKMLDSIRLLQKPDKPHALDNLIATYVTDSSQRLIAIQKSLAERNHQALEEAAHSLKGSSASLGLMQLAEACKTLVQMGRTRADLSAPGIALAVESAYHTATDTLQNLLHSPSSAESQEIHTATSSSHPATPVSTAVHRTIPLPTILLIEDNPVTQRVALSMLESLGYQADTAANGYTGLAAIIRGHYQLVLMDCQMPEMDGYLTTQAIRSREATLDSSTSHLPVIAVTANTGQEDRDKCLAAGMDDYLSKPYNREQLQAMLQRWLPRTLLVQLQTNDDRQAA